ncbi:MAG: NAD(P)H-dependent oxidoreductase [Phycisphaeraceae bacterium]
MHVLVIGCSLNPHSYSQLLAREAVAELRRLNVDTRLIDLREHPLPLCDGGNASEADPALTDAITHADAIVLATPVYNFDVSAATKNLIELTGQAWRDKLVGFACAAGGAVSFMSAMGLANSLMLDFQCVILPRFVYTTGHDYQHSALSSDRARQRLQRFTSELVRIGTALKHSHVPSPDA